MLPAKTVKTDTALGTAHCPKCGALVQQQAEFCANCGIELSLPPEQQPPFPRHTLAQGTPVSTGPYKAVIALLLVTIVVLGVLWYAGSSGFLALGAGRYQLSNPPNSQSTQPPPGSAAPPPYTLIWNACGGSPSQGCSMAPNGWREGTIPDTYDYFVQFTSTVPITAYFFTLGQFVQYSVCNGDVGCVSGSYLYLPATTSQQTYAFRLAEGCGDYVAIYVASASGTIYPSISVKQNSASAPTGYCAQSGGA